MDIDFHYYATYVAACFAGYPEKDALTIATSAQMIDENSRHVLVEKSGLTTGLMGFPDDFNLHHRADGPSIHTFRTQMTFQGLGDIGTSSVDTLSSIWPVFHFLPGNFDSRFNSDLRWQKRQLKESLQSNIKVKNHFEWLCRPHSAMAIRLINNCRELIHDDRSVINRHQLANYSVGVTAHVFVDTWAHQDFVGFAVREINSRNEIEEAKTGKRLGSLRKWDLSYSFLQPRSIYHLPSLTGHSTVGGGEPQTPWKHCDWEQCAPPAASLFIDNTAIGHGIVGHLPDHSSLIWRYKPAWSNAEIIRNNPIEYFDAFVHLVWAMRCIRLNQTYTPFDVNPHNIAAKLNISPEHLFAVYKLLTQERDPWCSGTKKNVRAAEDVKIKDCWDGMIFIHGFQWQDLIENVLGLGHVDSWTPLQSDWVTTAYRTYKENQEIKKGNWFTVSQFKSLDFFKFNVAAKLHYRFVKQELLANGKLLLGNWADGAAYADDLDRIADSVSSYETWRLNIINQLSNLQRTEKKREVNEGITILIKDIEAAESLPDVCGILRALIENVNKNANAWSYGLLDEKSKKVQSKSYLKTLNTIIAEYNDVSAVQQPITDMTQGALIEYDKHERKFFSSPSKESLAAASYLQTLLNNGVSDMETYNCLLYLLGLSAKGSKSSSLLLKPLKKGSKFYTLLYQALIKSSPI